MAAGTRTIEAISHGVGIRIRLAGRFHDADLSVLLPPGAEESTVRADACEFRLDTSVSHPDLVRIRCGRRIVAHIPAAEGLRVLRKHIQLSVADLSPTCVFIHAGVVVWNDCAIICPGRSFAGKSTLVWSLVRAGAIYYSDEFAVFDENGFTHAFPVPLSLRTVNGRQTITPPSAVYDTTQAVAPGLVLCAEYSPGAEWAPLAISPGTAALCLLRNAVGVRRNPSRVLNVVSRVVTTTQAYSGRHSESATVTAWIEHAWRTTLQRPPVQTDRRIP